MMIVGFSHKLGDSLAVGCASWDLSSKRRQEASMHTYGLEWALWWAGRAAASLAVISCILGARAAFSATVLEGGGGWNQSLLRLIYSCSLVKKEYKLTALFISQIKRERESDGSSLHRIPLWQRAGLLLCEVQSAAFQERGDHFESNPPTISNQLAAPLVTIIFFCFCCSDLRDAVASLPFSSV